MCQAGELFLEHPERRYMRLFKNFKCPTERDAVTSLDLPLSRFHLACSNADAKVFMEFSRKYES